MAENPRIEELRRRVQADPASIAFAALAEEFRRIGRYEEAIETCRTGLQRHPAYLSARVTLGRALIEVGDLDGARQELDTVLQSAPENLAAIRGLAQIHERLGHSGEMDPHLAAQLEQSAAAPPAPRAPVPPPEVAAPEPIRLVSSPIPVAKPRPAAESAAVSPELPSDAAGADFAIETAAPAADIPPIEFDLPLADIASEPLAVDEPPDIVLPDSVPEPAVVAAIARLERFLGAIQAARRA